MAEPKTLLTGDDVLKMPLGDRRYELLDGVLVEMPPTNGQHGRVEVRVGHEFVLYSDVHGGLVMTGEPGIYVRRNPDRVRAPDVCFWVRDRVPPEDEQRRFLDIIPDVVVEVISPSDSASGVQEKVVEWLNAGVRLVWAVYPETRLVVAYRSTTEIRMYSFDDTIDAAPVLPDFFCPVANFFK